MTIEAQIAKKVSNINLRIISKPHAHLQSMLKTSAKFQKNRNKTVGGVAYTRYILLKGDGRYPQYHCLFVCIEV